MDEHEALIEYSEMTSFNFNSKEFQEVKRDYLSCRNMVLDLFGLISEFFSKLVLMKNY